MALGETPELDGREEGAKIRHRLTANNEL